MIPTEYGKPVMSLWQKAVAANRRLIIAHRGARSLAPENTLIAAQKAFDLGAHGWELDIRLTADGVPVIIHDALLRRTSDVEDRFPDHYPWEMDRYEYREIQDLDFGRWFQETDPFGQIQAGQVSAEELESYRGCFIPTLDQALELTRERDRLVNLELKDLTGRPGDVLVVEKTVEAVHRAKVQDRVLISSFRREYLDQVKSLAPDLLLALLNDRYVPDPLELVRQTPADYFHPHLDSVTLEQIKELSRAGVPVLVWTVNEPARGRELLEAGASALITDFPQLFTGPQS